MPSRKKNAGATKKHTARLNHRLKGDLVIEGFRRLADIGIRGVDDWESVDGPGSPSKLFDYPGTSTENINLQLHSWILPLLRHQLVALLPLLEPAQLRKRPVTTLKLISELQVAIAHSMTRVHAALALIHPRPLSSNNRTDDGHLKQFKTFRLHTLMYVTGALIHDPIHFFQSAGEHIKQIGFSTKQSTDQVGAAASYLEYHEDTLHSLDVAMECTEVESEMQFIEDYWCDEKAWINVLLGENLRMIDPTVHAEDDIQITRALPWNTAEVVCGPLLELLKLLVPIWKLFRTLYRTLQKIIDREELPTYSDMNSRQLSCLCQFPEDTARHLQEILELLHEANGEISPIATREICDLILDSCECISDRLSAVLLIALLHLVPMIPEDDGLPDQNYYQSWFRMWHDLMILAFDHFLASLRRFRETAS
ncbi:hypothetical protein PTTG_27595 [Puccinia triticina 1-1 BBBD Race 1]|uniref:Uncharacterized protein n=2 Tax=Puccinia triticina TaxID=208348 RepID=A0A180GJP3_PUCT1|nr:uncharacterized protein PtA15_1A510 [Puccinia triticina]OAV92552.1 hypothetical protein PTTG_27595 [Puccinia triticina 1-1 BBBD Race 1]WAQ81171.1 hypothetical protein PtA15_1A510 [Puccinia triticina]WAR52067.1 hypothetical protein PtB15_1B506 [Puccinia triticina]